MTCRSKTTLSKTDSKWVFLLASARQKPVVNRAIFFLLRPFCLIAWSHLKFQTFLRAFLGWGPHLAKGLELLGLELQIHLVKWTLFIFLTQFLVETKIFGRDQFFASILVATNFSCLILVVTKISFSILVATKILFLILVATKISLSILVVTKMLFSIFVTSKMSFSILVPTKMLFWLGWSSSICLNKSGIFYDGTEIETSLKSPLKIQLIYTIYLAIYLVMVHAYTLTKVP